MDALLIDRWLEGAPPTRIHDEASVIVLREDARARAKARGFDDAGAVAVSTIVSELASNQLRHARDGMIALREIDRQGDVGMEILAVDRGDGIADPTAAIDGGTSSKGLGIGLSGAMRLADEVDFDVRMGAGTCVRARKLLRRASRRREVAVISRACEGERIIGDDAIVVRTPTGLRIALADGLGHGGDAREPASAAIEVVRQSIGDAPAAVLERADRALERTRGSVMTVIDLDEGARELVHCAVGNVATQVVRPDGSRSFTGSAFVLGAPRATTRLRALEERVALGPADVVVVASDGVKTAARVDPGLLHRHPVVVAHEILRSFGRTNDDATVIVIG
jgi:anti-sigma regulatory factor (Ser/Thr protein kinase)